MDESPLAAEAVIGVVTAQALLGGAQMNDIFSLEPCHPDDPLSWLPLPH